MKTRAAVLFTLSKPKNAEVHAWAVDNTKDKINNKNE